jgi:putative aminophosphonate oxidoreductase
LPERVEDAPPVAGNLKADVCIVGGGYFGLWTALRLKEREPSLDVAVVEGDICGGGASGRNAGFVLSWWAKFNSLQKLCATDEAVRLAKASADAVSEIGAFCQAHEIDAHYRYDGWLWAATSAAQDGSWRALVDHLARHQLHPFEEWRPEQVARRAGSVRLLSGVFEPTAATVQPALLARGLRRVAMASGVRIYEHSPMRRLKRSSPPRVVTKHGSVTAEKVIIAMNAWAAALPELRRSIVVVGSDMVATEPVPTRLAQAGLDSAIAISDSRILVNACRTTLDGRIAFCTGGGLLSFGNKVDDRFEGASRRAAEVEHFMRQLYPDFGDVPVATSWTGPIDRSATGIPFFGRLNGRADLLYGLGFSGNGVGPTVVGARIMASLALEADDEWASCGLVRDTVAQFPREPFRYYGGRMVIAANRRKERLEDAGRKAGPLTRRVAALAPAGLVPVKGVDVPNTRAA